MHGGGHNHHDEELASSSQPWALRAGISTVVSVALPMILRGTIIGDKSSLKSGAAYFFAVFASLTAFDAVKKSTNTWMSRMKNLQSSIYKHSTPLTRKFFFKNENAADRVTLLGIVINVLLSASKLWGGLAFNSAVLISDAGHSLSDLLSDFITLWAVQVARLPADEDHPYGHGKFESVGSLFLSLTLLVTGLSVGTWSYDKMVKVIVAGGGAGAGVMGANAANNAANSLSSGPTWPALLFALASILSKEWIYRVTKRVGLALNSQIIVANACT